jgi:Zn-dependent protease/FixJ family two-component response regulator
MLALVVWSLGASYFPDKAPSVSPVAAYALGVAAALLLCLSILAHEFGHAIVARRNNIAVVQIDLWLLGGMSKLAHGPRAPRDELRYGLAGPGVSAALTAVFAALLYLVPYGHASVLHALVEYAFLVNASLLAFNILPAFPLDGGRALRAALWRRGASYDRATEVAAEAGRGLGYLLLLLGGVGLALGTSAGLWSLAVGVFLIVSARAEAEHARLHGASAQLQVAAMMSRSVVTIPDALSVQQAADSFFLPYHYSAFPVTGADATLLGIVTLAAAEAVPEAHRTQTYVAEITNRDPALIVDENFDVGDLLDAPSFAQVGRAVVIDRRGSPIGLISLADVRHCIRALRFASPAAARTPGIRARARGRYARSRGAPLAAGASAGNARLPTLLLADDDEVVRIMLSFQLEAHFSIVGAAHDARGAVALARLHHPDVAILDVEMPGGGLAATEGIASESPSTAIVILTADDSSEAVLRFVQAGAISFLRKGIAVPDIAPRLHESIATHLARDAAPGPAEPQQRIAQLAAH